MCGCITKTGETGTIVTQVFRDVYTNTCCTTSVMTNNITVIPRWNQCQNTVESCDHGWSIAIPTMDFFGLFRLSAKKRLATNWMMRIPNKACCLINDGSTNHSCDHD